MRSCAGLPEPFTPKRERIMSSVFTLFNHKLAVNVSNFQAATWDIHFTIEKRDEPHPVPEFFLVHNVAPLIPDGRFWVRTQIVYECCGIVAPSDVAHAQDSIASRFHDQLFHKSFMAGVSSFRIEHTQRTKINDVRIHINEV